MEITTIGIDIAKSVFQFHGVDAAGQTVLQKKLRRNAVLDTLAKLPSCLIGMEACATSHHWAREITALGHEVRLIPPAYVKPYVKLCSPQHNLTYHQVVIMRRNVRRPAVCWRFRPTFLRIISERIEPGEQTCIPFP